jgi:DNA-directed RNA polymerase specialized sigma24 family protein
MEKAPAQIDPLLEPLLREPDGGRADGLLSRLIEEHAAPVIKGVIRYKLHLNSHPATQRAEAEDLYQEALLQLLARLRQFRARPDANPVADLRGLSAAIAHRTCSGWMRRQFPERHALKNRLHYLLTRQKGLALWQGEGGKMLAGFAAWRGRQRAAPAARLGELSGVEELAARVRLLKGGRQQELAGAPAAVFEHLGGPAEFDELVGAVAALLGVRDRPIESLPEEEDASALTPAAAESDPAWQIEKRMFLQRLWGELQLLPPNQRAALLLNLRDAGGTGCITLFPATGVATLRQLADALGMSAEGFARLWNELPLEDARIAEPLGLTRQQVINARKSGRERLARRLKGFR